MKTRPALIAATNGNVLEGFDDSRSGKLRTVKDPLEQDLLRALGQELRAPLGAIWNSFQQLESDAPDRDARAHATAQISADVRAMSLLLERLQAVASPLAGTDVATGQLDIVSFVKGLLGANADEVRLEVDAPGHLVLADPLWLKQMLSPFLSREQIGASWPTQTVSIAHAGGMTEVVLETLKPRPFVVALVRAIARSQGGECLDTAVGDKTLLRFRLRRAR